MIRQFFKATLVVSMVASVLIGCNGSKPLGMGSEESISKIKELVKTNVDMNENKIYLTAKELAGMLGVSESQAYKMIRKINLELEKKGFITVKGKVSKYYIEQHWYGFAG